MKNKKHLIITVSILFVLSALIYNFYSIYKSKNTNIEKILNTSSYSYLSSNAKDYIRNYYYKTGDVLLTEKNKVDGEKYLNPDYIEYLDGVAVSSTGYVPNELTSDYNYNFSSLEIMDNLPSEYDSRNVDNHSYVTPTKRQYSELCWDYALTSTIESKLLKDGLENDASTLDLSERMIDYGTSDPLSAIDIEKNPYYGNYYFNSLSDSGNQLRYSSALVNGLFPISEDNWEYESDYMGKVKPEDVYDLRKINYQVNEIVFLKDNNYEMGFDENTNKAIKQYIINNGSAALALRVGAGRNYILYNAPVEERLNSNSSLNYLYYKDANAQYQSNDHMVSIIGWNDNYTRNICVLDNGQLEDSVYDGNNYSCNSGNLKTINGAWIIKDSANSLYHYVAYETVNSEYYIVTDVSYKNWDNVYSTSNSDAYTESNGTYTFHKLSNTEKVKSIKLYSESPVPESYIFINTYDGTGEKLLTSFSSEVGGLYTIPITNEVLLSSDKFDIRIEDSVTIYSIFTSSVDNNIEASIDDSELVNSFNYQGLLGDYENIIVLNGISRNVDTNINYIIKNSSNVDVTNLFNITRNYAIGNYINTLIRFNSNVPLGEYTGYAYINDSLCATFSIEISKYMEVIDGDGTKESPYIITNPTQLDMIRLNKYSYYKLGNDIDLTYDTQNENGLFYNDGLGWEPISYSNCNVDLPYGSRVYCSDGFTGVFDGDNHKIIGLHINRPNESVVGLFKNDFNSNYSALNFRNLILKDVDITGKNYVGSLIGYAYGTTYERNLIFENITVSGNVSGNNYVGGIIGYFSGGTGLDDYLLSDTLCTKRHCLNNLFNSSKVEGNNYVGGLIGLLETQTYYNENNSGWRSTIDAYHWQNNGTIISNNNAAGFIGYTIINNGNTITLNNSINTGLIEGTSNAAIVNNVVCNNSNDNYPDCSLKLNNIYYINDDGYKNNNLISANNVQKYSILDLTNDNIYSSFADFDTFYKKETIDNIKRIPFVKNAYVEYTSVEDILIDGNNTVDLYDYIDGSRNITYNIEDESIASIDADGIITPLNNGNTTIHITSYYDGYDNSLNLTITNLNTTSNYAITYNLNGGTASNPTTYNNESSNIELENPIREGYIFQGWTGSNGDIPEEHVIIQTGTTGDLTYIANWAPKTYEITLDKNNGTENGTASITVTYDSTEIEPSTIELAKKEHMISGFELDESRHSDGATVACHGITKSTCSVISAAALQGYYTDTENGDLLLEANTTAALVPNVEGYTDENGNWIRDGEKTLYARFSEMIEGQLPSIEKEGYICGWTTNPEGTTIMYESDSYLAVNDDTILYGVCDNHVTVTFKNSEELPEELAGSTISTQEINYGESISVPENPILNGYDFIGWYDASGNEYDFDSPVTENITIYAKWNINEYTVTFETNGGTHIDEIEVNHGLAVTKPTDPTKEGYTFDGWYLDETLNTLFDFETIITENITLYAKWNINEYTVTFNSNGGSEVASIAVNHGLAVTKPTDPTKEGYTFDGWYTNEECTNKFDFSTPITESIILYAKWIIIVEQYALIFDTNEGSLVNSIIVDAGDVAIIPADPTKSGYNFIEWNTKANGSGTSYHSGEQITIDSDTILYAIWVEDYDYIVNKYQISSDNKYIDYIPYGTSLGTFRSNIILNDNYTMSVDTKNIKGNEVLYTSGKTRIYRNSRLYNEYTNIVRGDVNGDGKIGIVDYLRIRKDIMSTTANGPDKLKNEFKLAADMNEDNKVGIIDYLRIRKIIMEEQ